MNKVNSFRYVSFSLFLVIIFCISLSAQTTLPTPPPEEEVIQVNTNLIQTEISVVDKNGNFIDNLKADDFEVKVDGKPITLSYFDKIIQNRQSKSLSENPAGTAAVERGRTLVFFFDDVHLSADSMIRTKKSVKQFIDDEMLDDDLIAIISSSGQVGFLQQFTSDKEMLKKALERVKFNRNLSANDLDNPPMSEGAALAIDRLDRGVLDEFIKLTLDINPGMLPGTAASVVQARARNVLDFARVVTQNTFSMLTNSINKTRLLPGRKAIFFFSDGFMLDSGNSNISDQLNKITNAAARSNTVIYTFDSKGLEVAGFRGAAIELASTTSLPKVINDRYERLDGLSYLADKTGGTFTRNNNDLNGKLKDASVKAYTYYLLSWDAEEDGSKIDKLKQIEISVKNRPNLKVQAVNGYLNDSSQTANSQATTEANDTKSLVASTNRLVNKQGIPVFLVANYLDMKNEGASLAATIQIDTDSLAFNKTDSKAKAELEIIGLIYDSSGALKKTFKSPLTINAENTRLQKSGNPFFYYEYQTALPPDFYQLRIAVRDVNTGKRGNDSQWLEIPDASKEVQLSSLLIGERQKVLSPAKSGELGAVKVNIDRVFQNTSALRYFGYIYNFKEKRKKNSNIKIQAQVTKNGATMLTDEPKVVELKVPDPKRQLFGGEILLDKLPPGRYQLKLSLLEGETKILHTRYVSFQIK